jgi:hypothetical protein
MTSFGLTALVVLWMTVASLFVMWRWSVARGVGLVISIVVGLSGIHWIAAALYVLPWYENLDPGLVLLGLSIAFQGLCAFCLGVVLVSGRAAAITTKPGRASAVAPFGWGYIVAGLVMYMVLSPRVGSVASLGAIVAAGLSYIVLGVCLQCWHADAPRLARWVGASVVLPFVTIFTQGFLSYGLAALAAIAAFVSEQMKSRTKLLLAASALSYVTMSFYVTYMRDRWEIRDALWRGAESKRRIDLVRSSVEDFEWFDPHDINHLWRIDDRLNQDYLVGLAVDRLRRGIVPFGAGETVKDAVIALLPRAIWPEKGVAAGSGDIVSLYTGLKFPEGTSVGVGLVMELFVNFGILGVWIGFGAFGALLVFIDERARRHLAAENAPSFAVWFLPGTALLQLCGGSLVDASASAAAAVVGVVLVNWALAVVIPHATSARPRGYLAESRARSTL